MSSASSTPKDLIEALLLPPPPPPSEAGPSGQQGHEKDTINGVTRQEILDTCNRLTTFRELPLISRNTILTNMYKALKESEVQKFEKPGFNDSHLDFIKSVHSLGYVILGRTDSTVSLCCPYGQVNLMNREVFENTRELQVMIEDPYVIKIWVKDTQPTSDRVSEVDPDTVFTYLETTLEEVEFCPPREGKFFRFNNRADFLILMKAVAYAIALKATRFIRDDNANLSPQIRAEVRSMMHLRIHPREDSESADSWRHLAHSSMVDAYYTHARNLYLEDHREKLKITQLAPTELWRRKSFPDTLCLDRKVHYSSTNFCRICALPLNQHDGKVHEESEVAFRRCFYPLCGEDEVHSVATCNAIMEVCGVCRQRGHNESHHDSYSLTQLQAIFLTFSSYNFKTSLLTVIQDRARVRISQKLFFEAWRTSLFLGKYSNKMATILGFDPPDFVTPKHLTVKRHREVEPGSKADFHRIAFRQRQKANKLARSLHWQKVLASKFGKDARSKISSQPASSSSLVSGSSFSFQSPRLAVLHQPKIVSDVQTVPEVSFRTTPIAIPEVKDDTVSLNGSQSFVSTSGPNSVMDTDEFLDEAARLFEVTF